MESREASPGLHVWLAGFKCGDRGSRWPALRVPGAALSLSAVPVKQPFLELEGLRVSVDRVVYLPSPEGTGGEPHRFVYFISIHNESEEPVCIKGRKWVVTNDQGQTVVVEGDGVVGQFPTIPPGGHFSYNSFHLLGTRRGRAEGSYFGLDGQGRRVITRIPPFNLEVPGEV